MRGEDTRIALPVRTSIACSCVAGVVMKNLIAGLTAPLITFLMRLVNAVVSSTSNISCPASEYLQVSRVGG